MTASRLNPPTVRTGAFVRRDIKSGYDTVRPYDACPRPPHPSGDVGRRR
jgi:hypothetical protein